MSSTLADVAHQSTQPITLAVGGTLWFTEMNIEHWLMTATLVVAVLNIFKLGVWIHDRFFKCKIRSPDD